MRIRITILFSLITVFANAQVIERVSFDRGKLINKIPSLRNLKPDSRNNPPITRNLEGLIFKKTWKDDPADYGTPLGKDPVVQKKTKGEGIQKLDEPVDTDLKSKITSTFEGIPFTNVSPGDPCMAVGRSHIVQMINGAQGAYLRVWDKSGISIIDQRYMHQLVGSPDYFAFGDPIVLYDQFSDRYFISEFGSDSCASCFSNSLIIGVSQTSDPTGGWFFYKFSPGNFFVDYPHYSVHPDALYATSNDYNSAGTSYLGSSVYAIDKIKMLNGDPSAGFQRIRIRSTQYNKYISLAPVNISGSVPPPSGSPGLFMYFHDDNRTSASTDADSIGIFALQADFLDPNNSVLTHEVNVPVAPFKSRICNGQRNCVPSAGSNGYDDLSDRFMHKIYYRNFGSHESIVANHTVDASYPALPTQAGIRWYELRNDVDNWSLYQQGTYAPDENGRWMGGININSKGQIALAYNHSGLSSFASIYYTGRNATDPLGEMVYDETEIKKADSYGTFSNRWGDYNDLVTDPLNDSIFWFTAMYGSSTWKTRIASFRFLPIPLIDLNVIASNYTSGHTQCSDELSPQITVRNIGSSALTAISFIVEIDGQLLSTYQWNGMIQQKTSETIPLPAIKANVGSHNVRIYANSVNDGIDENPLNDTTAFQFYVLESDAYSLAEGFDGAAFPPPAWRIANPNAGTITWENVKSAGTSGTGAAVIKFFDYGDLGQKDKLITPLIRVDDSDSLIFNFDLAYKLYGQSSSFSDSLEVLITADCGESFISVWKKGGAELISADGYITSSFVPAGNDWKKIRIDLKPFLRNVETFSLAFQSINQFGQNLYIDNVKIEPVRVRRNDAFIKSIVEPSVENCTNLISPVIEVGNAGSDTIKSVTFVYKVANNPTETYHFSGAIPPGESVLIRDLKPFASPEGKQDFLVYTTNPNGLRDNNLENDTLNKSFFVYSLVQGPLKESFEESNFPSKHWNLISAGNTFTWEKTKLSATDQTTAAWIRNYRFNSNGKRDELVSPNISFPNADSVYVKFDLAHQSSGQSGPKDTLELLVTGNCGMSYTSIYKKSGLALNTVNSVETFPPTDTIGFVPKFKTDWRSETIEVSAKVPVSDKYQFIFRSTSNKGNNIFLDNISIYGVILPARLKSNGYLISPNPTNNLITIQHLRFPVNLKAIQLVNEMGQVLTETSFRSEVMQPITISLDRFPPAVYQLKLIYRDRVITERIVKK